jgi:hypothetical protein
LNGSPGIRDITVGNNIDFNAGPGHDLVTGIGVPNIQDLSASLGAAGGNAARPARRPARGLATPRTTEPVK